MLHPPAEIYKTKVTGLFWSHQGNVSQAKGFWPLFPFTNQMDAPHGMQLGWDPNSRIPVEKHCHQDWCEADSPLLLTITPWYHGHKWQPLICQQQQSGQKDDTHHHAHTTRLWHRSWTGPLLHPVLKHQPAPNRSQRAGILQGRRNESLEEEHRFMENPSNQHLIGQTSNIGFQVRFLKSCVVASADFVMLINKWKLYQIFSLLMEIPGFPTQSI